MIQSLVRKYRAVLETSGCFAEKAETTTKDTTMRQLTCLLLALQFACSEKLDLRHQFSRTSSSQADDSLQVVAQTPPFWIAGWNAGFKLRRAATHLPASPQFFEACPDAPGGSCRLLGRGQGFYTLAHDQNPQQYFNRNNCRINSGELFSPRSIANPAEVSSNPDVPCPYRFFWGVNTQAGTDQGKNFARLIVDSSSFKSTLTRNNYLGLQENFIGRNAEFLLGLRPDNTSHALPANQVHARRLKVRSRYCRLAHQADPHFTARFVHYMNLTKFDSTGRVTAHKSIAINFQRINHAPAGTPSSSQHYVGDPLILNEGIFSSSLGAAQPDFNTWHVDAALHLGLPMPPTFADDSIGCNVALENRPWTFMEIPVAMIISNLQRRGILSAQDVEGAVYSAGIVAGIESWGRALVEMDIMDDQVVMKRDKTPVTAADLRAPYYCEFNTGMLQERASPGAAVWKKVVDCPRPGITPAASELEGLACRTINRIGVYQNRTYLCVAP